MLKCWCKYCGRRLKTKREYIKQNDTCDICFKEILTTSKDNNWKPCITCGGELIQVRKALWTCLKCNQEYIADEPDMREEVDITKIRKIHK